jgi:hypothetical protein
VATVCFGKSRGDFAAKKNTPRYFTLFYHILPKNQDVHEIEPVNNMGL